MRPYRQALSKALNKEIDFDSDGLRWTLHAAGYVPNADTHAYVSDLTSELGGAGGYTVGGQVAGAVTRTHTAADAWTVARANTTAYAVDDVVRPAVGNGKLYRCAAAGATGAAEPAWPVAIGQTVADGAATWECVGSAITVLDCADPSWPAATLTARIAVLSDRTPATPATQPLIGYVDFGADKSPVNQTLTVTLHPTLGALAILLP